MKKTFSKLLFSSIFLLLATAGFAQSVSGLVTSEDGPLPGAAVVVKGTSQ